MTLQVSVICDSRGDIAWEACRHSILDRPEPPKVTVAPLIQSDSRQWGVCSRDDQNASTELTPTRFLIPQVAKESEPTYLYRFSWLFDSAVETPDICWNSWED